MKKQLLNEAEVRKFMKFANIGSLTDDFVDRIDEQAEMLPDEEAPGLDGSDPGLMAGEEEAETAPEMEMAPEDAPAEDADAQALEGVKTVVQGLQDTFRAVGRDDLADALEVVDSEGADADLDLDAGADLEADLDAEAPMEEPVDAAADLGAEEEGEMLPEDLELAEELDEQMDEELVSEVYRAVARRLSSM